MIAIREFIRSGGAAVSDAELESLVRTRLALAPQPQKKLWLNELGLMLDGYAMPAQRDAAERLRVLIGRLAGEVDSAKN